MSYWDIQGHELGPTVGIMDRGIDNTIDHKSGSTDNVCGKYTHGYTVHCSGKTVTSLTVPSGKNYKCQAKKSDACSATTGISTTYYQIHACC